MILGPESATFFHIASQRRQVIIHPFAVLSRNYRLPDSHDSFERFSRYRILRGRVRRGQTNGFRDCLASRIARSADEPSCRVEVDFRRPAGGDFEIPKFAIGAD